MATINTIGTTGRDYSTLQAWEDAVPATPTGGYEGRAYKDSEFGGGGAVNLIIAGHTTSAANYIKLTTATGQSFQDRADVRTNPLYYESTHGVSFHSNPGAAISVRIDDDFVTIERFQFKRTTTLYSNNLFTVNSTAQPNVVIKDCIFVKGYSGSGHYIAVLGCATAINCVFINEGAASEGIQLSAAYGEVGRAINCTIVNAAAATGTGINVTGGSPVINNCAVYNWTTASSGGTPTGDRNAATNASGLPGANSLFNRTFATDFVSTTNDFRLKSGSTLINAGNTDATNAPNDISGFVRGSGLLGDIGAWEFSSPPPPPELMAGGKVFVYP